MDAYFIYFRMSLTQSKNAPLLLDNRLAYLRQVWWMVLLVGGAVLLGWSVAHERWLLLVAAVALPLLLCGP